MLMNWRSTKVCRTSKRPNSCVRMITARSMAISSDFSITLQPYEVHRPHPHKEICRADIPPLQICTGQRAPVRHLRYPEQTLGEEPPRPPPRAGRALEGLHPAEHRNSAKLVNDELPAAQAR